ncbi:MAG: hypothetical protein H7Y59_06395 [Anaerolineales bacterium]|nr:hypothetical protein [Anaerolineales bacterium]
MNQSFLDFFIPFFIFGWPLFIISVLTSIMGILNNRYGLVLLGTVLILPFVYYLAGTRTLFIFAILIPLFQLGCAWAVKEENNWLAWVLFSPTILVRVWLLMISFTYTNLMPF